ncbi:MAG: gene transfer agent family protein [Sphingomonadales bacterium]
MANPQRGEETLAVNGQTYTLRLDFEAIAQIEQQMGEGIAAIIQNRISIGKYGITDIAVIFCEMLRSGGHDETTLEDAGNLLLELGPETVGQAIGNVLTATLGGGEQNPPKPPRKTTRTRRSRGGA